MKSYVARPGQVEQKWYVVDASGRVLGRLATRLATVLMGKHKPTYTPHVDGGDYVIVLNAGRVRITGRKIQQKTYGRYTYYVGGYKEVSLAELLDKHPERVIELAVRRMLPKNKLGRRMLRRLKVYRGGEHQHQAQQPEPLTL